jgi:hypothetical protein
MICTFSLVFSPFRISICPPLARTLTPTDELPRSWKFGLDGRDGNFSLVGSAYVYVGIPVVVLGAAFVFRTKDIFNTSASCAENSGFITVRHVTPEAALLFAPHDCTPCQSSACPLAAAPSSLPPTSKHLPSSPRADDFCGEDVALS